ncbi:DUF5713 family protein [Microbacterium sp. A93]|uniref:DUF5713 family protein n=1 Tax=Microbacterium sp. A93 TaxID=3450716 RepID=UPI003F423B27
MPLRSAIGVTLTERPARESPIGEMITSQRWPSVSSLRVGHYTFAIGKHMRITNKALSGYDFLAEMTDDEYFPQPLVEKGKLILVRLCETIEAEHPADLDALYVITHATTEEFNALAAEFAEQGSELETAARDTIGSDIAQIADVYGFTSADMEKLIAPRTW